MDDETTAKLHASLTQELAATYTLIVSLLTRLPIAIRLPASQAADPEWAILAMSRAWELAVEEPLPLLHIGRIRDMITAWLTAYELAVAINRNGPGAWRLRGMDAALLRVRACGYYIDDHLIGYGR